MLNSIYRFPAEWEQHSRTWIAWPHEQTDWLGKFETVDWVYADIVRVLSKSEHVNILVSKRTSIDKVKSCLELTNVDLSNVTLLEKETDRSWLRDSAPISVIDCNGSRKWVSFKFNAWAKYNNFESDTDVPDFIAHTSQREIVKAMYKDKQVVLEGGALETDGQGTLIVTEECLLSTVQERNVGYGKSEYEKVFSKFLGTEKTIWLKGGIGGDDTHGHVDDITRFVSQGKVVTVVEDNPSHPNYEVLRENREILLNAVDAKGRKLEVIELPMPEDVVFGIELLPASYANFYIANTKVLVPVFNDVKDRVALSILAECFPEREVVGINARDLVLGQGTFHCLTQQEVE